MWWMNSNLRIRICEVFWIILVIIIYVFLKVNSRLDKCLD